MALGAAPLAYSCDNKSKTKETIQCITGVLTLAGTMVEARVDIMTSKIVDTKVVPILLGGPWGGGPHERAGRYW